MKDGKVRLSLTISRDLDEWMRMNVVRHHGDISRFVEAAILERLAFLERVDVKRERFLQNAHANSFLYEMLHLILQ